MKQGTVAKCLTVSGIMLIFAMFAHLVNTINNYDSYVDDNARIVSAFNG